MLIPLDIPPGVYRNGTRFQSQGRYYDADLWRFFEGTERPVGGWRLKSADAVTGKARALLTWVDNSNRSWAAVATNEGLFVYNRSGALFNITPEGFTPGRANADVGGGYGRGAYGKGAYGTPRPDITDVIPPMVWTLDTWGEYLVACDGSNIYEWQLDTGVIAAPIANAPSASAILVTEERILVALGADGDPRYVQWSDSEDNTDWTPAGTNLAGGKRLQTNGKLMCGKRLRGGYILFTDTDAHLMTYANLPNVYDFERLATGCGIVSKQGVAVVDSRAFWWADNRFWSYNGQAEPLESDVGDFVFGGINSGQNGKVYAVHNSAFGEIWWFYPSATSVEIDRYVTLNYREGHWNIGKLQRLCGTDKGVFQYPLMVDNAGQLWEHEVGTVRDGRSPYLLSGPVEIGSGERTMNLEAIIPDERTLGDVEISLTTGDWTMSPDEQFGPYPASDKTDIRVSGRRVSVKKIATPDIDFRVGQFRFEAREGSRR